MAEGANIIMSQMIRDSPFQNKLVLGHHNLESYGIGHTHNARYKNVQSGIYDGVHLFGNSGASDYTGSLNKILRLHLPEKHWKAIEDLEWQVVGKRKSLKKNAPSTSLSVTNIQNRFTPLVQGN